MSGTYPIKGIPLPTDPDPKHPIPVRQEIDAWYSNPDNAIQVSLFIQAMDKFQKIGIKEQLSYYQVAGIHGLPWTDWDGVTGGEFCKHNTATFPTWHRPYVLLLEQRLYEIMLTIIDAEVPDDEKKGWRNAASHWRFPYWDWAVKRKWTQPPDYGVPELVYLATVSITMPHKGTKTLDNPLYQFTNPSHSPMGDKEAMGQYAIPLVPGNNNTAYWVQCVATSKFGILSQTPPEEWVNGVQNIKAANEALQNPQWYLPPGAEGPGNTGSIGETVYRMFSENYFNSWEAFASTLYIRENPGKNFLSVEYIHNNIHNLVGGSSLQTGLGHMSDVPVAAFDPVFWLHHCNVDRQIAIFQTLNPNKWFDSPSEGDNKPTDPLKPFHVDTQSTFWNSDKTRDWTKLNYQYDSLEPPKQFFNDHGELNRELYLPELKKTLNKNYSTRNEFLRGPSIDGHKNDYIVNILYDRYALNGQSYTIHFFIGPVEGDAHTYAQQPHHVGSVYTFSSGSNLNNGSQCANCKDQMERGVLSTAQIHLTIPLLKDARDPAKRSFNTLNPDDVSNYLRSNLHWKAEAMGEPIGMDRLPQTKIYALQGTAEHTTDDTQLSHYHSYTPMWEACAGKPGAGHESDNLE